MDNQLTRLFSRPGYVVILAERLHDARIIPLDGRPLPSSKVRSWTGILRGHWEGGNTLEVEARNTHGKIQAVAARPVCGASLRYIGRKIPTLIHYRYGKFLQ